MGPTGVVLELSHEDWEKMQKGATFDELKTVKEYSGSQAWAKKQWDDNAAHEREKKKTHDDAKKAQRKKEDDEWAASRGHAATHDDGGAHKRKNIGVGSTTQHHNTSKSSQYGSN